MLIKVCMYGLILEDAKGNQKKVTKKNEVMEIIKDVYYNDDAKYVVEDSKSMSELAKYYGFYVIENSVQIIKMK